jgi:hypothetical protein
MIDAAVNVQPVCDWTNRGAHRVTVPVASLVDNYVDIPKATRDRLKARIDARQYEDIAHIKRDSVTSEAWKYGPLKMMHFGAGKKVCGDVDTSKWADNDPGERGLVYCEDGHCLIVPTVCANLSRIERVEHVRKDRPFTLDLPSFEYALEPLPVDVVVDVPELQLEGFDVPFEPLPMTVAFRGSDWWPDWGWSVFQRVTFVDIPGKAADTAAPVPEMSTIAMMALGLGLVGFWARRKT